MVIRLSPATRKLVEREAKARGVTPSKVVEDTLKERLAKQGPREEVSEARKQLRELLKHKKPTTDFMEAVHAARRYARQLEEDNAEWIDWITQKYSDSAQITPQPQ